MLVLETTNTELDHGQARITGALTLQFLRNFLPTLAGFLEQHSNNIIDLSGVTEIDTAGFQLLAAMKKHSALSDRKLKFIRHSAVVLELIDLYGVTGLFRDKIVISRQAREAGSFGYGIQPQEFAS